MKRQLLTSLLTSFNMEPKKDKFSADLVKILIKAIESKIYGSVEVYFEAGKITQITQRIINKVSSKPKNNSNENSEANKVIGSL